MARNRQRAKDRKAQHQHQQQPIHRENVPGELNHASGDVDEVEASIVAGADGEAVEVDEEELAREAVGGREEDDDEPVRPRPAGPRPGGNRFANFLRASWAELQRVQWPDRRQVAQATAVVLGFVAIAGAYLGLADSVAQRIVNFIL
jgi:preprotein translocase SecE subunit